ncbi:uncharacterized protein TNCV_3225861 [Trichonephila clavipes]|nr:uncharacterized protein TNCV_3225861 [Trichonephila clavipes]
MDPVHAWPPFPNWIHFYCPVARPVARPVSSLLTLDRATMPVVSDPCSCQSDCLVCGRGEESLHDCAIHVLLESMVFQERMLHGEPTEAKLVEILKHGKEYLPLAMLMTDENSVRWQTMYNYVKSGFPQHQGNSSRNVR